METALRFETTAEAMAARLVRYGDLRPCLNAFIDTRTPGSDRKENFTIIGPGVSENPEQHVHIAEPHGFNIGAARQPPGCHNSQHSHDTAEVFFVHSGTWVMKSGETGEDGAARMGPGDIISLPTRAFRGFENIGPDVGFLWAVLGGDDPGRVLWAPYVFDMARDYGLVLLDSGRLVDTANGETVPVGQQPMPRTSPVQIAGLQRLDSRALEARIVRHDQPVLPDASPVAGVVERGLIGADAPLGAGHGFTVREWRCAPGAQLPQHRLDAPDVWFLHFGNLDVQIEDTRLAMGPGDTFTVPRRAARRATSGPKGAVVIAVRGGEAEHSMDVAS